ncbi:MAG: glycine--tRNA ligase [Verrucomicrobia bacterium CG1_02_43_26]|nr:MAG: glycine--tRNA ligase [Verrucomicrobia bacterium CG1_02_43_26]
MDTNTRTMPTMDNIVALCKRRGFIFHSSEIYGGINGFFDYGPMGSEMRRNIKNAWWQDMIQERDDMVGLDSSIIMHSNVWKASGHIEGFSDPMVDCKESKLRYRADQLFFAPVSVDDDVIGYVSVLESGTMQEEADKAAEALKRKLAKQGSLKAVALKPFTEAKPEEYELVPSPATGKPGSLTAPRDFNLMFETSVGAMRDESSIAYLRPETAQGIFANFKNVVDTTRVKVPFGIAQIGKAFRNEITPRNYIFRSREFEQMEIEYFIPPQDDAWEKFHQEWVDASMAWLVNMGLDPKLLDKEVHSVDKLAHYAKACTDIVFQFPFGKQELQGIAARGNYDLMQHQEHSGKSLEYFDEITKERYVPHVIEPSIGVDRLFLALMCSAYQEDEIDGEKRIVLKLHPRVAPIKVGIFPLLKNKPELVAVAEKIYQQLRKRWNVAYDASGAIGRRYRRMDEVGTPFGVTIDFETLENNTVTLRDRDTTKQERISIDDLLPFLQARIDGE